MYVVLTRSFVVWREHYLLANAVAFLVANGNSFFWNRLWTFNGTQGSAWRQYGAFLGVSVVYLGFIQLGLWFTVSELGLYDLVAKVIVIGLAMLVYFTVLKRWVFRAKAPKV